MLPRVVRLLTQIVDPIVVVAASDQSLPELPGNVIIARDERPDRGPLEGLLAGLSHVPEGVDAVYATGCDVPLLVADFVRFMFDCLDDEHDVAVPLDGRFHHPLAAVYRVSVKPNIEQLLDSDRLRPVFLYEAVPTRRVPIEDLRQHDPDLLTLANLNRPEDYLGALAREGLEAPAEVLERFEREA